MSGSNRLPVLAAEIRKAHADVQGAAKTAAERAITAGHALIEAKELVKHGEWLPWLRENCALPERTAQLYMKIAKSGDDPEVVAMLGLEAASKALVFHYDPYAACDEAGKREWFLFILFLSSRFFKASPAEVEVHVCWCLRHGFNSPAEWLGDEGEQYRTRYGMRVSAELKTQWAAFLEEHRESDLSKIGDELASAQTFFDAMPKPSTKRRQAAGRLVARKRKSATVADLEGAV